MCGWNNGKAKKKINHDFKQQFSSVLLMQLLPRAPQVFVRRDQFFISFESFDDLLSALRCLLPLEIKSMLLQFLFITVSKAFKSVRSGRCVGLEPVE